jgi:hypothetical protein
MTTVFIISSIIIISIIIIIIISIIVIIIISQLTCSLWYREKPGLKRGY